MSDPFPHSDTFVRRHLGPRPGDLRAMLEALGVRSLDELIQQTVPAAIRSSNPLSLPPARSEMEILTELEGIAAQNQRFRSLLGMGYHDTFTPPVILRNVLLNPGWYTQYTPYQAEIAQGRLEALLNFQTMVSDLTGLGIANASLLDEGTAAAEAMSMLFGLHGKDTHLSFFVSELCHPQTIEVVRQRAKPLDIEVVVGNPDQLDPSKSVFGVLLQYPGTDGAIRDYRALTEKLHAAGVYVAVATDLLALTLLQPPGEWGADVVVGSSQRFGVPMGFGGPHAAFFATRPEFARSMPGRLIGVSVDANGKPALRMALQTREQHIRREKATSNICTAQVLLAVMSGMYAVYHGPEGLKAIAERVHRMTGTLAKGLTKLGFKLRHEQFFDTICVDAGARQAAILDAATKRRIDLRRLGASEIGIALDECTTAADLEGVLAAFAGSVTTPSVSALAKDVGSRVPAALARSSPYLTHPVFNTHHSETEMQRYLRSLEAKDLSLTQSMIPLGSCTMKLNAAVEMTPVTWPEFGALHPFAPQEQADGYHRLFRDLEAWLAEITGFSAVSLQPNAGSQGEYAGLLVIRAYHESRNEGHRKVCLIPQSAHGTNPASAVMAGYQVVVTKTDESGNIDVSDLRAKAEQHAANLAALMVTYPSTHGVFEESIREVTALIHQHGGQVYMDGANMNAQVGLTSPGAIGADVCHLNLHKTFCIPHGGGGPGMGPIAVAKHLAPFLPTNPVVKTGGEKGIGPISAAPWGSASILLIPWVYVALMGGEGLTEATRYAILNANYVATKLEPHYPVLYQGKGGRVAHECILDMRHLKKSAGVEVEDIAKRLMDYGFHAPTVSFPVASTMMVEPTESEPKAELDRFIEAMIAIRHEIRDIEEGKASREDNPLKHAPHTAEVVVSDRWSHAYSREVAAFPTPWVKARKFWPSVGRLNNVAGDKRLVCSCPPIEDYLRSETA